MRNNAVFPVVIAFKSIFSIAEGDRRFCTGQSSNSKFTITFPVNFIFLNRFETIAVFDGYALGFTNDTANAASTVERSEIGAVIEVGV